MPSTTGCGSCPTERRRSRRPAPRRSVSIRMTVIGSSSPRAALGTPAISSSAGCRAAEQREAPRPAPPRRTHHRACHAGEPSHSNGNRLIAPTRPSSLPPSSRPARFVFPRLRHVPELRGGERDDGTVARASRAGSPAASDRALIVASDDGLGERHHRRDVDDDPLRVVRRSSDRGRLSPTISTMPTTSLPSFEW